VYLEERTVDVNIRRLRKILEVAKLDHYIQTVRSHGYRFVAEESHFRLWPANSSSWSIPVQARK